MFPAAHQVPATGLGRVHALAATVVHGEDVVDALFSIRNRTLSWQAAPAAPRPGPSPGSSRSRHLQLPPVFVPWCGRGGGRDKVCGDGASAVMVDAAVAPELEILSRVAILSLRVVEGIGHAHAFDRLLRDAVHLHRL